MRSNRMMEVLTEGPDVLECFKMLRISHFTQQEDKNVKFMFWTQDSSTSGKVHTTSTLIYS